MHLVRSVPRRMLPFVSAMLLLGLAMGGGAAAVPGSLTFVEFDKDGVGGVDGLDLASHVIVSNDGKHVYVTGGLDDAVATFSRNTTTGALTFVEFDKDGVGGVDGISGANGIAVSPDDKHVYVTGFGDQSVATFSRNAITGALTFVEFEKNGVGGVNGIGGASGVAVSPDGNSVYVTGRNDDAVAAFSRDPATGALTFIEFHMDGAGGVEGIKSAEDPSVSPNSSHVYVTGFGDDAVATFSRNATTGALTFVEFDKDGVGGVDGLDEASGILVSRDGNHVYVSGTGDDAVATFSRNATSGALTFVKFEKDGVGGVDGIDGATDISLADGNLYVAGDIDNAVATFARNASTGSLTFVEFHRDGVGGVDGVAAATGVVASSDGRSVYVAGQADDSVATFSRELPPPLPRTTCGGKPATIVGTSGNDKLTGTNKADVIVGLEGNDTVRGGGGKDLVCAGDGNDPVNGGGGKDTLKGQDGDDTLKGAGGNDRLVGGKGKDTLIGGPGTDQLRGGPGVDRERQ